MKESPVILNANCVSPNWGSHFVYSCAVLRELGGSSFSMQMLPRTKFQSFLLVCKVKF